MATIGQIVEYMNENKIVWHPQSIVEVVSTQRASPGSESYPHGYIPKESDLLYIRFDSQKYIGHYYISYNLGNGFEGMILLPLNTGKYLKAIVNSNS